MGKVSVGILRAIACAGAVWLMAHCFDAGNMSQVRASDEHDTDWSVFLPAGQGQMQVSSYCSSCHSLGLIVADRRTDEAGWAAIVEDMISKGAPASEDDAAAMAPYLARYFSAATPKLQLPVKINSEGKQLLQLLPALSDTDVTKILDARKNGPLKDAESLEAVIGKEKLNGIKTYISFR